MGFVDSVESLHLRSLGVLVSPLQRLIEGRLWAKILVGMILGVGVGFALGPDANWVAAPTAHVISDWLALPGQIFLGVLQMIVVPLVFASIIRGLAASESVEQLRRLGLRLAIYFLVTTTVAVTIGLVIAFLIDPGSAIDTGSLLSQADSTVVPALENAASNRSVPEMLTSLLPVNPLGAMVDRQMLHNVVFAILIGVALLSMKPEQSKPLLALLGSLQEVCMTLVRWAMLLAPVAVFGLIARLTSGMGLSAMVGLAVYVATVVGGLAILLLFYLLVVVVLARRSPTAFLRSIRQVMLLAFSTSSSAAVMPLTIKTAEKELKVRPSIAQFVVPMGATINMDGTALYQAVATVFLAQATGVDLSTGALVLVVVTTIGASIGSPSTPGVGIVLLASVLTSVGIPLESVALIIGVDRILDMSRTAVNVAGDLTACVVMDRWIGGTLSSEEERQRQEEHQAERVATGVDVLVEPSLPS